MGHPFRFKKFIEKIRPTTTQLTEFRRGHTDLRRLLRTDPRLRGSIVSTFLQGSYRRSTAIRSMNEQPGSDVDLVLVTNLDPQGNPPDTVLGLLQPFLRQHYPKWRTQDRSLRITLGEVELDLVLASAPSRVDLLAKESGAEPLDEARQPTPAELAAWKSEPLLIPDRSAHGWRETNPLAQLAATWEKNARCNSHYINVVKAIKWWKLATPGMPEHPKSYPLERLVEAYCPDGIGSIAEGVTRTLEAIAARHANGRKPRLDGHHVHGQDVLARVPAADFRAFVRQAADGAKLARQALECDDDAKSAALWQQLFGPAFPAAASDADETEIDVMPTLPTSLDQLLAVLSERGQLIVSGFEQIGKLKRTLQQAVEQLGIRVVLDPSTPPELQDYLGLALLNALSGGFIGATVGVVAGAVFGNSKEWVTGCAIAGAALGALRAPGQVKAGWRLRSWYDGPEVFVELKVLP